MSWSGRSGQTKRSEVNYFSAEVAIMIEILSVAGDPLFKINEISQHRDEDVLGRARMEMRARTTEDRARLDKGSGKGKGKEKGEPSDSLIS